MAYIKQWINGTDVMIDEATGALLVGVGESSITLAVDMIDIDVEAITGNKSQADIVTALTNLQAAPQSAANVSSGTTAKVTTSEAAVELIAATEAAVFRHAAIHNTGAADGFFSLDGGTIWHYLPASTSLTLDGVAIANAAIQAKRNTSDLSGLYASAW